MRRRRRKKKRRRKRKKEKEDESAKVDFDGLDVFGVEDYTDLGGGMPLFKDFEVEDWALASLRFELHLLTHAFRKDVDDPERTGIYLEHLWFYYHKYFKKTLNPKFYGKEDFKELMTLVKDTIFFKRPLVIESKHWEDVECLGVFIKL